MRAIHWATSISLLALLAGCDDPVYLVQDVETVATHLDTWFQEKEDYSDILLVVDNSGSMEDEQQLLGNSFGAFTEFIHFSDTEYHIGVVTTDTGTDSPLEDFLPPVAAGVLQGEIPFITRETENADAHFRNATNVGINGNGRERGFESAQLALSPPLVFEENLGFYREEALLNVIFVSDEDDQSGGSVMDVERFFYEMKGFENGAVTFHGLVGVNNDTGNAAPCGAGDPTEGGAMAAIRYAEIIRNSRGVAGSICEPNFNEVLREIGRASTGIRDRFLLSSEPVEGSATLTMAVPGTPEYIQGGYDVPRTGRDGEWPWTVEVDVDGWWLRFTDPASLPPGEARMQLAYELPF